MASEVDYVKIISVTIEDSPRFLRAVHDSQPVIQKQRGIETGHVLVSGDNCGGVDLRQGALVPDDAVGDEGSVGEVLVEQEAVPSNRVVLGLDVVGDDGGEVLVALVQHGPLRCHIRPGVVGPKRDLEVVAGEEVGGVLEDDLVVGDGQLLDDGLRGAVGRRGAGDS